MLTAAVAGTEAKSGGYLRACLHQTGLVQSVVEWSMSTELYPGPGESVPDVVLLDLARETEPCFAFAAYLRRLRPSVCIIACSPLQQPGRELLMRAMRSGVQEFLHQPIDAAALRKTLACFIKERGPAETGATKKLIVVIGSKGGVGTSTVAVNLGVQLTELTQKRVVLLDFARPMGHVSLLLDLQPRFSIRDAVENLERLDGHFFGGLLTRHRSGLNVLAGTSHADEWLQISVPTLASVVNVAQSSCDFALIDLGSMYSSEWTSVLRQARTIILVAEANVPALWTLARHISHIASFGLDPERFRIIINRWRRQDEEALKSVEKNTKRPIFARLPDDFQQVSEATNLGMPLSKNHDDSLGIRFRELACRLVGIAPATKEKRGALTKLFSSSASAR